MKLGYARVSTDAQETHLQIDALKQAKCTRIYQEKASSAKADRPELMKLLDHARKGDVVIVWKLDRLARSIRQLLDTTALLNERGVELALADREHQHHDADRQADVSHLRRPGRVRARHPAAARECRIEGGQTPGTHRRQAEIPHRNRPQKGPRLAPLRRLHQGRDCQRAWRRAAYAVAAFSCQGVSNEQPRKSPIVRIPVITQPHRR